MKTIREWFEGVSDEELSKKMIRRAKESTWNNLDDVEPSLYGALNQAFPWRQTPEGREYWYAIHDNMKAHPENFSSKFFKHKQKLKV